MQSLCGYWAASFKTGCDRSIEFCSIGSVLHFDRVTCKRPILKVGRYNDSEQDKRDFRELTVQIRFLILGYLCLVSTTVFAMDFYRWVDERGQQQMSDMVPDKYRDVAVKVNTRKVELTPEQQREAQTRSTQERDRASNVKATQEAKEQRQRQREAEAEALAKAQTVGGNSPGSKLPAGNCTEQWREFWEKTSCYLPYRNRDGGLRPGWEQNCANMQSPAPVCQIPTIP